MALKSLNTGYALFLFGVSYFLVARLGLVFFIEPEKIASIWPVSGLALAVLMLVEKKDRYKYIAVIFVVNTLANLSGGNPLLASLGFALANTAESAVGMWAFYSISGNTPDFKKMRDLMGLAVAAFFVNGLTAFLGAAVPFFAFGAPYWQTWKLWWVSDGLGILLVAPCILTWANIERILKGVDTYRLLELLMMLALISAMSLSVFGLVPQEYRIVQRPYWLIGLIVLLAVRFESWGVMLALLTTTAVSLFSVVSGIGSFPWIAESHIEQMLQVQGYLITTIALALSVSVALSERQLTEESLKKSEALFKAITSNNPDHILVQDNELRYLFVMNPQLGLTEKDMIGKTDHDFLSKEDADKITEIKRQVLMTGRPAHVEVPLISPKGEKQFFDGSYIPKFNVNDKIDGLIGYFRNVTESKHAEEKLIQIMKAVESASDAIGISDALGHHFYQNKALSDMFGYATAEELEAAGGGPVVVKNPKVAKEMFDNIMDGKSWSGELEMVTKNGRVFPAFERADAIKDNEGKIIGLIGIVTDITARKRADMLLKETEERYQSLFEQAGDGIFILDTEGKIISVNETFALMHGFSKEEILRIGLEGLDVEGSTPVPGRLRRIMRGETLSFEVEHYHKDGHTFPLSVTANLISSGSERLIMAVHRDISERKRIEEVLREKERLLSETQQISHIGSWTVTLNSMQSQWSDESYRIFGVTPERFILTPESFLGLIYGDDRPTMEKWIQDCVTGQHLPELEFRVVRPDGTIRFLCGRGYLNSAPDSTPLRLVGSVQDITERKQEEEEKRSLEERLQRAEKMEALGQLAGGVAHDLNNVLGVLSGYSELLVEKIPEDNPLRKYAENILKSTEKGAAIIQDLLTLARRGVVVSQVVDINSIVSNLLATMEFGRLKDFHSGVTFSIEFEKDVLNIKGSPVHLEKTVMNLVSNAAEAIVGAGEVTIRTENRYLDKAVRGYDQVNEGDYVVLSVSDTGGGIPAADLNKIFEPFYTKKKMGRSGTGLGLAIVWGTVKDHEGYIDVRSAAGKGTSFTLYFPVTREKMADEAKKIPVEEYLGHGESVLVVDDVEGQRMVATALLMELGYRVHAVSNGEEALEYLKGNNADIMILDMIMDPGIDGLDTYRKVLEINPRQKAIIVSGFSETDRVRGAQRLGAGAYVKKPYVTEKIGMAIRDELVRE